MPLYTNWVGVGYVAAASVDCSECGGMGMVEKGVVIGEMRVGCGFAWEDGGKKSKSNDRSGFMVSHRIGSNRRRKATAGLSTSLKMTGLFDLQARSKSGSATGC